MAVVRRKKENIDLLEHAMMGVHTSEIPARIVSLEANDGLIGTRSRVVVDLRDLRSEEREVVVRMHNMPKVKRRRTP
jgi:hypothetical protein